MPEFIANVATQDGYVAALTLGPAAGVAVINFSVLGQPVLAQFYVPIDPGSPRSVLEQNERLFVANTVGLVAKNVGGVRFRSAITGTPAFIVAEMVFDTDPLVAGSSISSAIFNSAGQIIG